MCKKIIAGLIVAGVLALNLTGCSKKQEDKKDLTISIAASLQKPMEEIKKEFENKNKVIINYNVGGSGTLEKQIVQGANVDVFFSANEKYVNELINKDLINKNEKYNILQNSLVLIESNKSNEKINNLNDLVGLKEKIAIGEVNTVPAGQYAKETLENLKLWDKLKGNFVYAKSVTVAKNYVEKGEADFGFVYKTDAINMKNSKIAYEIPSNYHKPIIYSLGIIKNSKNNKESKEFVEFLKSNEAKRVFKEYGFKLGE